ncbi:hypothetical protein DPQ33_01660 [Oceanidesulfovibrio indonesiensis]|jgi:hypothetical protein|uniref:Uncharacterized protein n=1 Tax=Oceanidesulfovibrio indonesiensis TaxID=54767 RepID=A0A7M3MK68_9BACT|nr:hypothetical protein [Oceanidesulfovibrio indonesiensis]TVM19958.1 hypothetical protein DPQ33_01660 [Oceanidesulfovibrio indonesiensis]
MQIVISNGNVAALHEDGQQVQKLYPGAEIITAPQHLVALFEVDKPDPRPALPQDVQGQITGRLLSVAAFVGRFTDVEKSTIMTSPELAPLALHVLAAPSRMVDVTDVTAQLARAALEQAGWPQERLDAIFAVEV